MLVIKDKSNDSFVFNFSAECFCSDLEFAERFLDLEICLTCSSFLNKKYSTENYVVEYV